MSKASTAARLQNDFGADLWVKNQAQARQATAGRGLFAGLQDVKHYNVENGWAKRSAANEQPGLIGLLWKSPVLAIGLLINEDVVFSDWIGVLSWI
ncbi:hypothetical protein BDV32DRAFT_143935 [Aspergillus pseudonomiae]|uniref:Uncharacterized protein n=2 Tax=Aspergillus subgen. Circumdati TaxID=2720871 RepID=A0A5N7DU79_9EURO|nr:uncharacterized protein BDV37DRAFT_278583 [Aspergillus pseudonomiae]KAB8266212.1 hypothetical protein BDV32DRAFT_143935 [Aspergillus pseudonomiae]KAE8409078.1 hypothetical protein BDV37DRAFT_278583 [Aspergillus pseudonomiae]